MQSRRRFTTGIFGVLFFLISCASEPVVQPVPGDDVPVIVNPTGSWTGSVQSGGTSEVVTLDITIPVQGIHGGTLTFVTAQVFLDVACSVSGATMSCSASGGGTTVSLVGPITATSYTGNIKISGGGTSVDGTFTLSRAAQP